MKTPAIAISLAVSQLFVLSVAGSAGPVVIKFDEFIGSRPGVPASLLLSNEYASQGVTFNGPALLDYSQVLSGTFAHSGVNGIEQCYSKEFCTTPIRITFTAPQSRVKVWVGYRLTAHGRANVVLEAFDTGGNPVGSVTTSFAAGSDPEPIRLPLELALPQAAISVVEIRLSPSTLLMNGLAVDDLEFDTAGPLPSCLSGHRPVVDLIQPVNATTVQLNDFLLSGSVNSDDPLTKVIVLLTPPAGASQIRDLPSVSGPINTRMNGFLLPGFNTVTLLAESNCGSDTKSASVNYVPILSGTQFEFLGLEITQAIQNMDNTVPLIAGKRAIARVYLRTTGPTSVIRNVSGDLTACRPLTEGSTVCGDALPTGLPADPATNLNLRSLNTITVDSSSDITAKRRDMNNSLNFELPPGWTNAGLIHFGISHLQISTTPSTVPCPGCDNPNPNYPVFPRFYQFQNGPVLSVAIVGVPYKIPISSVATAPRAFDFDMLTSWLTRAYPSASIDVLRSTTGVVDGVPDTDFDCNDINSILSEMRGKDLAAGGLSARRYYGIVHDASGFMRGCSVVSGHTGSGPAGASTWGWDTDGAYTDWYAGHELGHQYGREHPGFNDLGGVCTATALDPRRTSDPKNWKNYLQQQEDADYPFAGGLLSNADLRYFGFDVGDHSLGLGTQVYEPDKWSDMMTYCQKEWISSYTYQAILSTLGSQQSVSSSQAGLDDGLLVVGLMNLADDTLTLQPFSRMAGLKGTSRPQTSSYSIDLLSSDGIYLARYPFEPRILSDTDQRALLDEVVPYVPGTRRIVISKSEVELASRRVSPNAPQVTVLYPNGGEVLSGNSVDVNWRGTDLDGDPLTYTVMYSVNSGQTWTTLAVRLTGTSYPVNLADLAGSDQALFRVMATDGVNTGFDDSNGTFHVPFKAPQARIISPATNSRFSTVQTIVLNGQASDSQDGGLSGAALQWNSDRQGSLGAGKSIAVQLAQGTHLVTLKARNSHGDEGQATVILLVVDAAQAGVPADVNGDGKADCADVEMVKAAFGKRTGETGFDSRADVNLDGLVDNQDLDFVSKQLSGVCASQRPLPLPPADLVVNNYKCMTDHVSVDIANTGGSEALALTTRMTFSLPYDGVVSTADVSTPAIAAGTSQQLQFPYPPGCAPDSNRCTFLINVNSNLSVPESVLDNNTLSGNCINRR